MQSSAMVAFRTLIMITCLVAVPLAALTGTAVTKVVRSALGDHGSSLALADCGGDGSPLAFGTIATADNAEAKPRVVAPLAAEPTELSQLTPRLPTARITGVRAVSDAGEVADTSPEPAIESAPLWNAAPRTASAPRNREMTAHNVLPQGLQKTAYSPHDSAGMREGAGADADDELLPIEPAEAENRFDDSEERLRELGANYYRLENWGDDGKFYRCSCSIAAAPHSRATRHFEAVEASPSDAIDGVIRQVQAWRNKSRR